MCCLRPSMPSELEFQVSSQFRDKSYVRFYPILSIRFFYDSFSQIKTMMKFLSCPHKIRCILWRHNTYMSKFSHILRNSMLSSMKKQKLLFFFCWIRVYFTSLVNSCHFSRMINPINWSNGFCKFAFSKNDTINKRHTVDAAVAEKKRNESRIEEERMNQNCVSKKENPITLIHDDISYGSWHRRNVRIYFFFMLQRFCCDKLLINWLVVLLLVVLLRDAAAFITCACVLLCVWERDTQCEQINCGKINNNKEKKKIAKDEKNQTTTVPNNMH